MRFSYFYFMKDTPERVRAAASAHIAYWHDLNLRHDVGGPFADRSGGLLTFDSDSVAEATRLVADDPFLRGDLIEHHWLKEWITEPGPPG